MADIAYPFPSDRPKESPHGRRPEKIPSFPADYVPPQVWSWDRPSGGQFASINRPIAGPTHDKALPVGAHPLQLYSLGTPNGQKVTILLEELLAAGHAGGI